MRPGSLLALATISIASAASAQPPNGGEQERAPERSDRRDERDPDRLGWYVPDFARVHTGGFIGMFVIGTGYAIFDDVLNVSAHYGFTPASHAGNDVHTFSFDLLVRPLDFRIDDFRIVPIYLGPGLLYAWGDEFFSRVPGRYDSPSYYPPTSLHWTARAGLELDWLPPSGVFERHGLFYEVVMLDTYFNFYRKNPDTLSPLDMLASAVGYRAAF
jgi:hypothetical protein